jgi:hypothetical protein
MTHQSALQYGHYFDEATTPGACLFVSVAGRGTQVVAQRVLQVSTGKLLIRKVTHRRLNAKQQRRHDNEFETMGKLHEAYSTSWHRLNIVQCLSTIDIEGTLGGLPTDPLRWARVSYWTYYNGGDLQQWHERCSQHNITVPRVVVLKFIRQIVGALDALYKLPVPVLHSDLIPSNVFVHWADGMATPDFFLGDFGSSRAVEPKQEAGGFVRAINWDLNNVLVEALELLHLPSRAFDAEVPMFAGDPQLDDFRVANGALKNIIARMEEVSETQYRMLQALPTGGMPKYMDLDWLVQLAEGGLAQNSRSKMVRYNEPARSAAHLGFRRRIHGDSIVAERPRPMLHHTVIQTGSARNVHGPWYIAKVNMSLTDGTPSIEWVGVQPHSRPNTFDTESESGESSGPDEFGGSIAVRPIDPLSDDLD